VKKQLEFDARKNVTDYAILPNRLKVSSKEVMWCRGIITGLKLRLNCGKNAIY